MLLAGAFSGCIGGKDDKSEGDNQPPTAAFTWKSFGLTATFDGSASSDADGSLAAYAWDFGDGETGEKRVMDHTYAAEGSYDVVLTVTDDLGATDAATKTVTVTETGGTSEEYGNYGPVTWYLHNPSGTPQESPDPPGVYASRIGTLDADQSWQSAPQKDYAVNPVNPVALIWLSGDFTTTFELEDTYVDITQPAKCRMFVGADYSAGLPVNNVVVGVDLRSGGNTGNSGVVLASSRADLLSAPMGEAVEMVFDLEWQQGKTDDITGEYSPPFDGIMSGPIRCTVWLGSTSIDKNNPASGGATAEAFHVYDTAEYPESVTFVTVPPPKGDKPTDAERATLVEKVETITAEGNIPVGANPIWNVVPAVPGYGDVEEPFTIKSWGKDGIYCTKVIVTLEYDPGQELPDPVGGSTNDLDLALFCPDGSMKSSGNGAGEPENVDISHPDPGDWKWHIYAFECADCDYNVKIDIYYMVPPGQA